MNALRALLPAMMLLAAVSSAATTTKKVDSLPLFPRPKSVTIGHGFFVRDGKEAVEKFNMVASIHGEEYYRLHVSKDSLTVSYGGDAGKFYALQTLSQLQKDGKVPACDIEDWPSYPWRGCMIDVSRHLFPFDFLLKQVDVLAHYKVNRLHIHLTDAGGWRMQIRRYPLLTQLAAWRTESDWRKWWIDGDRRYLAEDTPGAYGGYYTQDQLRLLVDYAVARGMTVVPEIEMPGHSDELTEAYPELKCEGNEGAQGDVCPSSEATFTFLENVLDEVMDVFPSRWIHIGGDEAGKDSWARCPRCQQKARELGLQSTADLQGYLMQRMANYLLRHGREAIGWDEILDDSLPESASSLGPNVNVMVWRSLGAARKAMSRGHNVILSPGEYYVNRYQDAPPTQPLAGGGYMPMSQLWERVDPSSFNSTTAYGRVIGVQGNLWTEYIATPGHAEYMLYPRLLAIAEVGWNGRKGEYGPLRDAVCSQYPWLATNGVNAFDLRKEHGDRPEKTHMMLHKALGVRVIYNKPWSERYPARGALTLTDGYGGGWAYADGAWQGFLQTADSTAFPLDVTLDLGSMRSFGRVSISFMQSSEAWIYYPSELAISVSDSGQDFSEIYNSGLMARQDDGAYAIRDFGCSGKWRARFVRVRARARAEGEWLFTDEIRVTR